MCKTRFGLVQPALGSAAAHRLKVAPEDGSDDRSKKKSDDNVNINIKVK